MIRLCIYLAVVISLALSAAWVAEQQGTLTLHWQDYEITSSASVLLACFVAIFLVGWWGMHLLFALFQSPKRWLLGDPLKNTQTGLSEITRCIAALTAQDVDSASRHSQRAARYLGESPITLLLSAQIARQRGNEKEMKTALESMLAHPDTEFLAARMLSESERKDAHFDRALSLATKAHLLKPKDALASQGLISLLLSMKKWEEAESNVKKSSLTRPEKDHLLGLLSYGRAEQTFASGNPAAALIDAKRAMKLLGPHVAACVLLSSLLHAQGETKKALDLLEEVMERIAHADLLECYKTLRASLPERERTRYTLSLPVAFSGWYCRACGTKAEKFSLHCPSCNAFDHVEPQGKAAIT